MAALSGKSLGETIEATEVSKDQGIMGPYPMWYCDLVEGQRLPVAVEPPTLN